MKPEVKSRLARTLRARRRALMQQLPLEKDRAVNDRRPEPGDWLDQAAAVDLELVVRALADTERAELAEIDAALERLARGHYGKCELCGRAIPARRLEALPETRTCVECASGRSRSAAPH